MGGELNKVSVASRFLVQNKRDLRANRNALHLLALRPRLLKVFDAKYVETSNNKFWDGQTNKANNKLNKNFVQFASLIFIGLFSLVLQNSYVSNTNATSLTLTVPSKPLSLNLTPSAESNFAKSEPGRVSVITDNITGYTLSIKSGGEGPEEDDGDTNAKLKNTLSNSFINSISEFTSEDNFRTDPKFNNSWGYLPSKFNGSTNTDFLPAPITESSTIEKTESANSDAANNYDFTVAAKIDQTIPSGDYQETFIFSSTVNEIPAEPMQDWKGCDSLSEHETVRLRDTRDNKIYTVSKLKDGQCWMTQNLSLGGDEEMELTPEDSDISSNFTLPVSDNSNWNDNYDSAYVHRATNPGYMDQVYYSWFAATAGTGTKNTYKDTNASSSICPKGWRLPTGGSGGEFEKMAQKYGSGTDEATSAALRTTPVPNFTLSGFYVSGSEINQGSVGYLWSSTSQGPNGSDYSAYTTYLGSSSVRPANDYHLNQYYGHTVRCLAKEKTMQTVDEWGDKVEVGNIISAIDERDGKSYKVARLSDGKLWMIDNLRLGGDSQITLNSSNSDVDEDFILPASTTSGFSSDSEPSVYVDQKYGGYYTWLAATAGSGTTNLGDNQKALSSICPKGWRLPTSNIENNDFANLVNKYSESSQLLSIPSPGFMLSGGYYSSQPNSQDTSGYYWSSVSHGYSGSYYFAYGLSLSSNSMTPNSTLVQLNGFPVRCIAEGRKSDITIKAGEGIKSVIVVYSSNMYKPYYATEKKSVSIHNLSPNTKLTITVIPEPGHKLDSWTRDTNSGKLESPTLLTTTYTVNDSEELIANGAIGSYDSMQSTKDCSESGNNVTDDRDGKSYSIQKINNRCFMLSNLRLDGGDLNEETTDINSGYNLTTEWGVHKPAMKIVNDEYYYNWRAAIADSNTGETAGVYGSFGDEIQMSYSICPKGWTLPSYKDDLNPNLLWDNGNNPVNLYTNGYVDGYYGELQGLGTIGFLWSNSQRYYESVSTLPLPSQPSCYSTQVVTGFCQYMYGEYRLTFRGINLPDRDGENGYSFDRQGTRNSSIRYNYGYAYNAAPIRCILR